MTSMFRACWWMVSVLLFIGCESQQVITLGIGHIPTQTAEVQVMMAYEKEGSTSVVVSNNVVKVNFAGFQDRPNRFSLFRIGATLPTEIRGRLIVGAAALNGEGKLLGAGDGFLELPASGELAVGIDISPSQSTDGILLSSTVSNCLHSPLIIDQVEQISTIKETQAQNWMRLHGFGFLPNAKALAMSSPATSVWRGFSHLDVLTELPRSPTGTIPTELTVEQSEGIRCTVTTLARTVTFKGVLTDPNAAPQDVRADRILGMPLPLEYEVKDLAAGDLDGDGFPDLFLSGSMEGGKSGFLAVLRNRGKLEQNRFFDDPEYFHFSGGSGESVVLGDWNADGKLDAAVTSKTQNRVAVFYQENGASGQRFRKQLVPGGSRPDFIIKGDADHDGKIDLITGSANEISGKSVSLIYNLGQQFDLSEPAYFQGPPIFLTDLFFADMTADQKNDFTLVYSRTRMNGSSGQLETIGAVQTFVEQPDQSILGTGEFLIHGLGGRALVGDLDGNGTPDLLAAGPYLTSTQAAASDFSILLNQGLGVYQQPCTKVPTIPQPFVLALGDFNLDGLPDVVVANVNALDNGRVVIHLNQGSGLLATQNLPDYYTDAGYSTDVEVTDFNQDGKPDLVILSSATPGTDVPTRIQALMNTTRR